MFKMLSQMAKQHLNPRAQNLGDLMVRISLHVVRLQYVKVKAPPVEAMEGGGYASGNRHTPALGR